MNKPEGALVFYREIVRDEPDTAAARIAAARIEALAGRDGDRKDESAQTRVKWQRHPPGEAPPAMRRADR